MQTTRRECIEAGAVSVCAALSMDLEANSAAVINACTTEQSPMRCLDYGLSFLGNPATFNSVRFWVESRTTIIDDQSRTRTEYYQCASCKSEHTFAERDLFHEDNYDFMPVFGAGLILIFRRPARLSSKYRQIRKVEDVGGVPILKLREPAAVTVLDTWEMIRDATAAGLPIVTQTEIANPDLGLRAVIECPTKTMNISIDRKMYQVDTGPISLPDLSKRFDPQIDCLRLAFVAFNAAHFADFVVEQPTPVIEDGKERCKIHHYSAPFSVSAKNVLLALGKL